MSIILEYFVFCLLFCAHPSFSKKPYLPTTYDYIVVGSGTAGSIVASRLSENGRFSVLLLEAGGNTKEGMDVPALQPRFWGDGEVTYQYPLVPQPNIAQINDGNLDIFSGKMLGGTGNLFAGFWVRGNSRDYDNWANITGDSTWMYENMLPFFKKSENYQGRYPTDHHGYNGPIPVTRPRYAPGLDTWLDVGREMGYPIRDLSGPQQISFGPIEFTKKFGRLVSTYMAYIQPHLKSRANLHVLMNTQAEKIVFDRTNKAVGVNFIKNSDRTFQNSFARARREIIISGGAIESPVLLLKSGIGPKNDLQSSNIKMVKELPVGKNLHDHMLAPLTFIINNGSAILDAKRDLNGENWRMFNSKGDGPYSSIGSSAMAYVSSRSAKSDRTGNWADIQIVPIQSKGILNEPYLSGVTLADWEVPFPCFVWGVRPQSRGVIILNPRNASGLPLIDPKYLSHPNDPVVLLDGIKQTLKFFEESIAYRRLGARLAPISLPQCAHVQYRSDDYWRCYITQLGTHGFHPTGSCRMGRATGDPRAVVDSQFRVIGVKGLRVVDASIMPQIVNTNPMAAVIGIAEKGAFEILKT